MIKLVTSKQLKLRLALFRQSLNICSKSFDLILISDLDEIPNPKKIGDFNVKNTYACFIQMNLQSKINLLNIDIKDWPGTKICKKKMAGFNRFIWPHRGSAVADGAGGAGGLKGEALG